MTYCELAKEVFDIESRAISNLANQLDSGFTNAVDAILRSSGRVVVCGMGKSGIIGKKIAATLASTGTPSFFMHPAEAYHGDLGMITSEDVFLALSNSGETDEVLKVLPFLKDNGNTLIAMTGNINSSLARSAEFHLNTSVAKEACPLQLAPTSSTTASLAMGDALAVCLMKARDFQPENFARFHPGGSLGRLLLSSVEDVMIKDNLPFVPGAAGILDLIEIISKGGLGIGIVNDGELGIVTDGDLRRAIESKQETAFNLRAREIMTRTPATVSSATRMEDALLMMSELNITTLLVKDGESIIGVVKK